MESIGAYREERLMIKHVSKENCDLFLQNKEPLNNEARISHIFRVLLWTPAECTLVFDLQDGH